MLEELKLRSDLESVTIGQTKNSPLIIKGYAVNEAKKLNLVLEYLSDNFALTNFECHVEFEDKIYSDCLVKIENGFMLLQGSPEFSETFRKIPVKIRKLHMKPLIIAKDVASWKFCEPFSGNEDVEEVIISEIRHVTPATNSNTCRSPYSFWLGYTLNEFEDLFAYINRFSYVRSLEIINDSDKKMLSCVLLDVVFLIKSVGRSHNNAIRLMYLEFVKLVVTNLNHSKKEQIEAKIQKVGSKFGHFGDVYVDDRAVVFKTN